jgi:siroheme synthase
MLVVATAGLLGLAIAVATPYQSANAYSGQSLVFAEHACLEYGVTPHTAAFESCVSRAASAFDRGQPDIAYMQVRSTRNARDACLSYGLSPETLGYHQCVATQIDQRMNKMTLIRDAPASH